MNQRRLTCIIALLLVLPGLVRAATPGPVGPLGNPQQARSPIVNEDKTVTFQIRAPEAQDVQLVHYVPGIPEGAPDYGIQSVDESMAMTKGEDGVWSCTMGPFEPGLHYYHMLLDGVIIPDPGNSWLRTRNPKLMSILSVPGDKPNIYDIRADVPHGSLTHHRIICSPTGQVAGLRVYTPASYLDSDKKYPVFYLIHGAGGDEDSWVGRAMIERVFDNWIADGTMPEMVVVLPWAGVGGRGGGRGAAPAAARGTARGDDAPSTRGVGARDAAAGGAARASGMGGIAPSSLDDYFLKDLMPFVEKNYRVLTDRDNTAVGGHSMGGRQSLTLFMNHPDRFGAVCVMSGAIHGTGFIDEAVAKLKELTDDGKGPRVLSVMCGTGDGLIKAARDFDEKLKTAGLAHDYAEGPGGHTEFFATAYMDKFLRDFAGGK